MRRYSVHDDFAGFFDWLNWSEPNYTMLHGQLYNPDTHYLVARPEYRQSLLEQKEKRLQAVKEERQKEETRLKEIEKSLQIEIEEIKKSLSP